MGGGSGKENGGRKCKEDEGSMDYEFEGIEWEKKTQHHTLARSIEMGDGKACSSHAPRQKDYANVVQYSFFDTRILMSALSLKQ